MISNQNYFMFYHEKLSLPPRVICTALGIKHSTLKKWLQGEDVHIPLIAIGALKMLWYMKTTQPSMFCDWLIIQDFGVDGDQAVCKDNLTFLMSLSKKPNKEILDTIEAIGSSIFVITSLA